MLKILFSAPEDHWAQYREPIEKACARQKLEIDMSREHPPAEVDYIVYAPNDTLTDFGPYRNAKAVLNLWAGVEGLVGNATLTQPLARMVDPGLTEGMVEYVTGHVLRHHLGMDSYIVNPDDEWRAGAPPLARQRKVAVLGLGALGSACARMLRQLNFTVLGWASRRKSIEGVLTYTGDEGLETVLRAADVLVLLLPLTPETENLLDARRLGWMPQGAVIINPGRGALIDDSALLEALDDGRLAHATLDVFRQEPLPRDHPFWSDPKVTVTPHIASETRPETAAQVIAENIARGEAGEPLLHLVDRAAGY
jgi:glyoxylate/hydroxypyruvate reductase A